MPPVWTYSVLQNELTSTDQIINAICSSCMYNLDQATAMPAFYTKNVVQLYILVGGNISSPPPPPVMDPPAPSSSARLLYHYLWQSTWPIFWNTTNAPLLKQQSVRKLRNILAILSAVYGPQLPLMHWSSYLSTLARIRGLYDPDTGEMMTTARPILHITYQSSAHSQATTIHLQSCPMSCHVRTPISRVNFHPTM